MSRPLLNRRLEGLGTTIFAEMSARALVTGSVNLGQGFPDRDGPAKIARLAADAILAGRGNQYPPGPGVPELRQAIAWHQKRCYGLDYDPGSEVLVTAGATEAVAAALLALVEPGDEVIALEPYYDSYAACIAMAGGVRVPVTLRPPGFRPDTGALAGGGPFQYAVAEALRLPDAFFTGLRDDLRRKRDLLSAGLAEAGFEVYPPAGTYFVTTDIRPFGQSDGVAFCRELPRRAGVVAVPA